MPAKPSWFMRIPEILDQLKQLDTPVLDRHMCELLFGVRRRRTIELMQRFDGYLAGNTIVLDRGELIASLEDLLGSSEVRCERKRKQKLGQRLTQLHRWRSAVAVTLPVSAKACKPDRHASLPDGVTILDGRLSVAFSSADQLFARLYELALIAVDDFDAFRTRFESQGSLPLRSPAAPNVRPS